MAARRLILVMLVLLVLSSAVAALIPVERDQAGNDSTTTTTTSTPPESPTGRLVTARIDAQDTKPKRIDADKGDQLELTVTSSRPGSVEIVALGVLENVDRFSPARIDLLLVERGTYPVRLLSPETVGDDGREIGRLEVGAAAP